MTPRAFGAVALADFKDRVRRPALLAIMLAAAVHAYCSVPPGSSQW